MSKSIDEIIREAMSRGEFDNLKNKGKPLNLDEYFETPEEARMAYAMLKSADILPIEVELLKEIEVLEQKLKAATDEAKIKQLRNDIETRRLKYNLLMDKLGPRRA
jgi:hypothetical protein